jgi:plastocyanin
MLQKLNAYQLTAVCFSSLLAIGLLFPVLVLTSDALGQAKPAEVSIVNGASNPSATEPYNPSPLTVHVGTNVTWTNNDNTGHTVTEGNPSGNTPANGFDSGIMAPGKTFTHMFGSSGTIQYYCTLHPTMLGEVIVK